MDTELGRISFCYFDTETTGHDPWEGDRVVQAAVIRTEGERLLEQLDELVNPGRPIPPEVVPIHGITDELVAGKPSFSDILPGLLELLKRGRVVIHNAPFDLAFLDQGMVQAGMKPVELRVVDTLRIARRYGSYPGNALRELARYYRVSAPEPHQALTDVLILRAVAERMWADLGVRTEADLDSLDGVYARTVGVAPVIPSFWREAIAAGREIMIYYRSTVGHRPRKIVPRRFSRRYGQEYLVAYCHLSGEERTFRLDRLKLSEPPGDADPYPEDGECS
ncbi:MAG TPA: exonuclease domain-containing protein [bacterium]|nr:exonuclease domain-containing protein [bacterium]